MFHFFVHVQVPFSLASETTKVDVAVEPGFLAALVFYVFFEAVQDHVALAAVLVSAKIGGVSKL